MRTLKNMSPKVEFLNLKRINSHYREDFISIFEEFLDSGQYILGSGLAKFEKEFAECSTSKFCLGVANGLDALNLILRALIEMGRLRVGDEVIVPGNTFIATVLAVTENRLIPVFVDPDENLFNLEASKIKEKITAKTKAIIGVHLYGQLCDVDGIRELCADQGLIFIEDAAQAHGAMLKGKAAGSFGLAAGFSFYPGKNLGALGDGGAITTSDSVLYNLLLHLRNYGSVKKYQHDYKGVNSRLDELQAIFLSRKLKDLQRDNEKRRSIANIYLQEIDNRKIILPEVKGTDPLSHVWHLFVVKVASDREEVIEQLKLGGIGTLVHYPLSAFNQKAYKELKGQVELPISEMFESSVLSLPIDPTMTRSEISQVVLEVNKLK